jgi:predicted phage gp36 major capsid-like protein
MTTCVHCQQINVIETEEAIKNEQSRNTDNIRHTKHKTTTNQKRKKKKNKKKKKKTTQKIKKMSNMDPI